MNEQNKTTLIDLLNGLIAEAEQSPEHNNGLTVNDVAYSFEDIQSIIDDVEKL